jgi:hypothetical protein
MSGGTVKGQVRWMPSRPGGAWAPVTSAAIAPRSPPWAAYRAQPRRRISSARARAVRPGPQPAVAGLPEDPQPGSDGITRWKAPAAPAPGAAGSASGSMILSCSMTEPGRPWVTIGGSAPSWPGRTWMK